MSFLQILDLFMCEKEIVNLYKTLFRLDIEKQIDIILNINENCIQLLVHREKKNIDKKHS